MRIISGDAGGIPLKTVPGRAVRPTGDRVKESLFSVIGDVSGAIVFDLFAGSGALGLEALSRGASQVIFVEKIKRHRQVISHNLQSVRRALPSDRTYETQIVGGNAVAVAKLFPAMAGHVDLIFADPPYQPKRGEAGAADLIQNPSFQIWTSHAIVVLEHAAKTALDFEGYGWDLLQNKRFGDTGVAFLRYSRP